MVIDPHTAVGIGAARRLRDAGVVGGPIVSLATAHPAKFADAVRAATGVTPALPGHLADLLDRHERVARVANDLQALERFVERVG